MSKFNLVIFSLVMSFAAMAQNPNEVTNAFFEALNSKDHEALQILRVHDMKIHSLKLGDSVTISSQTGKEFIEGIKSMPEEVTIFEKIIDSDSIISEHLAQFTLPYEFYINGKLSHRGINVMTLLKTKSGWKVSYVADTREAY